MDTGRIITLLRTAKGLSQAELAAKINVSRATLSQVENGRIEPSLPFLRKIADYFDIPLPVLVTDKNSSSEFMMELRKILAESLTCLLVLKRNRPKQKSKKKTKIKA